MTLQLVKKEQIVLNFASHFGSIGPILKIQLLSDSEEYCASFWCKNNMLAKAEMGRNRKNLAPQK